MAGATLAGHGIIKTTRAIATDVTNEPGGGPTLGKWKYPRLVQM